MHITLNVMHLMLTYYTIRPKVVRMINIFQPSLGEEELLAIKDVFNSNWIGKGRQVKEFETSFSKIMNQDHSHFTSTSSCTEAIFLASELFDFNKEDEIIVPSISFVAVGSAVLKSQAKLIISDIDPCTLNITPEILKKNISMSTKAVIINHYGGLGCEIEEIADICNKNNIILIEDSACAISSKYKGKPLGTFGDMGFWSFDPMKIITTGDGGMVYLKDLDKMKIAKETLYLGLAAKGKSGLDKTISNKTNWWEIEINRLGRRSIMNNISGAIGNVQLKQLDAFINKRRSIAEMYRAKLSELTWLRMPPQETIENVSSNYYFWIQLDKRNELASYLLRNGIYTTFRYWPLNKIEQFGQTNLELESSDWVSKNTLNIPIHQSLSKDDVSKIIDLILNFGKEFY